MGGNVAHGWVITVSWSVSPVLHARNGVLSSAKASLTCSAWPPLGRFLVNPSIYARVGLVSPGTGLFAPTCTRVACDAIAPHPAGSRRGLTRTVSRGGRHNGRATPTGGPLPHELPHRDAPIAAAPPRRRCWHALLLASEVRPGHPDRRGRSRGSEHRRRPPSSRRLGRKARVELWPVAPEGALGPLWQEPVSWPRRFRLGLTHEPQAIMWRRRVDFSQFLSPTRAVRLARAREVRASALGTRACPRGSALAYGKSGGSARRASSSACASNHCPAGGST